MRQQPVSGSGTASVTGSATTAVIKNTTEALVEDTDLDEISSASVAAKDSSEIKSLAGNVSLSGAAAVEWSHHGKHCDQ